MNRYFGSKEQLFGEVCADTMRAPVILSDETLAAPDFDAMPPYSPNAFTDNRADVGTYSPIGRLFYVQLNAKF